VVEVVGRIPLLQPAFLEHANMVANSEGFFLIVGHQNRTGATGFQDIAHFVAELATQLAIQVGERLVQQQQLRLRRQGAG
jgi:hypothetical protein